MINNPDIAKQGEILEIQRDGTIKRVYVVHTRTALSRQSAAETKLAADLVEYMKAHSDIDIGRIEPP